MLRLLDRISGFLSLFLLWIAGFMLSAMTIMICANVFLRFFGLPLNGTFELMGLFGAIVTAFALGYSQMTKKHIAIDILVCRLSYTSRKVLDFINYLFSAGFFGIAAYRMALWAGILRQTGEVTETLKIIYYPFVYGVSLGCAVFALVFLSESLKAIIKEPVSKQ